MDTHYSTDGMENRRLCFVTDSGGTVHLVYSELSRIWLKKNKGISNPSLKRFNLSNKVIGFINIYDCTGLGLTGNEVNNIVTGDWS